MNKKELYNKKHLYEFLINIFFGGLLFCFPVLLFSVKLYVILAGIDSLLLLLSIFKHGHYQSMYYACEREIQLENTREYVFDAMKKLE